MLVLLSVVGPMWLTPAGRMLRNTSLVYGLLKITASNSSWKFLLGFSYRKGGVNTNVGLYREMDLSVALMQQASYLNIIISLVNTSTTTMLLWWVVPRISSSTSSRIPGVRGFNLKIKLPHRWSSSRLTKERRLQTCRNKAFMQSYTQIDLPRVSNRIYLLLVVGISLYRLPIPLMSSPGALMEAFSIGTAMVSRNTCLE